MNRIDRLTGDELNQSEAQLSRKIRFGDATPDDLKEYQMISRRMGNVNVSLDRQRSMIEGVNGFTPQRKNMRRKRRKNNINKLKGKKK